jgi:hypothetical protein
VAIDAHDVAHGELEALRAEILAREQTARTALSAALTVTAAVVTFALKKDGREETLLALPLILSGLGVVLVAGAQGTHRIAAYIRDHLWDRLPQPAQGEYRSWEHYIDEFRKTAASRPSLYVFTGLVPVLLFFVVPSVAALVITWDEKFSDLWPLWWTGAVSIVVSGWLAWLSSRRLAPPADSQAGRSTPAAA